MSDILFYIGLAITFIGIFIRLYYNSRQINHMKQAREMPQRYEEWKARYRTKRWYIFIVQMTGVIIMMVALMV